MKHLRTLLSLLLLITLFTANAEPWQRDPILRLDDPTEDDPKYAKALKFFKENEDLIRVAATKMLESDLPNINTRQSRAYFDAENKLCYLDEVWAFCKVRGGYYELFDKEYLDLANSAEDYPNLKLIRCGDCVSVYIGDHHDRIDFLRIHELGFYYIPDFPEEFTSIEDIIIEYMPDEWEHRSKVFDDYQLVRIADNFIYYSWHG